MADSAACGGVPKFGVRRTTLSDVARRTGVSRITVYNRFGDLHDLMRALMTLEFGILLEQAADEAKGEDARAKKPDGTDATAAPAATDTATTPPADTGSSKKQSRKKKK